MLEIKMATPIQSNEIKKKNKTQIWIVVFTPRYVSVSSKHVLSILNDSDRVSFPITPAVKGTGSPAVSGGAVTQHPTRVASNSRSQEFIKATFVKCIVH